MDRYRGSYGVVFPDYWTLPSFSLGNLYCHHAPEVKAADLDEVIRFLTSDSWDLPLKEVLTPEWVMRKESLLGVGAERLVLWVEGPRVHVGDRVVEITERGSPEFLRALVDHLVDRMPVSALRHDFDLGRLLLESLTESKRQVFLPTVFERDSTPEVRFTIWYTAFSLERAYYRPDMGRCLVSFKMLQKYPEGERPVFCDVSKYLYHRCAVEWYASCVVEYLHRLCPKKVKSGMNIRKALESLFLGKVKIPQDISRWDTPRIVKELKRHGYL